MNSDPAQTDFPVIQRVRHELRRRSLDVRTVSRLTPHMIRITLTGTDLADFTSASPDDHIKIFVPDADGSIARRDYTPRRYDTQAGELLLDFVDHPGGPAASWAQTVRPGDRLNIGGPKGSQVITGAIGHWLLIGDETALPAIGRRVEELSPDTPVTTVVAVPGPEDEQNFETLSHHIAHWIHRSLEHADDACGILARLENLEMPENTFIWVAAEAGVAKAIKQYFLQERHIPAQWIKASGYWVKGVSDASVKDVGAGA
ncbi:siderophore-interacting protein [Gluconobacter sp. Dm-62]|uniref:siderophore-interacting protein n=1 Tax=Gluconobacter sp. Dm-62 TaxID=2799804 RepID=UPI001B8C064B|nr:siderophore-interacting protein [Gluconobacter sp. Dm-62]MBS1103494.1 siderophore-interacting protein [Gluconobacter sp. Dm-62]